MSSNATTQSFWVVVVQYCPWHDPAYVDFFFCGHVTEVPEALKKTKMITSDLDGNHAVMIWEVTFGEKNKSTFFTKMVDPSSPATTALMPDQPLPTGGQTVDIGQEIHYCESCSVFYKSEQDCTYCQQPTVEATSSSFALAGQDLYNLSIQASRQAARIQAARIQAARNPAALHLTYEEKLHAFIQSIHGAPSLGGAAGADPSPGTNDDDDDDDANHRGKEKADDDA